MLTVALLAVLSFETPLVLEPVDLPTSYWTGWRAEVEHLMTVEEAEAFDQLLEDESDYSSVGELRLAFVEEFWRKRDPSPGSQRNEARESFFSLAARARLVYPGTGDPRAAAISRLGWPLYRKSFGDCGGDSAADVQVWHPVGNNRKKCTLPHMDVLFFEGAESFEGRRGTAPLPLVFYRRDGECRRLRPGEALLPGGVNNELLLTRLNREGCFDGVPGYRGYLEEALRGVPSDADVEAASRARELHYSSDALSAQSARADSLRTRADLLIESARLNVSWLGREAREIEDPLVPGRTYRQKRTIAAAVLDFDAAAFGEWPEELPWRTYGLQVELTDIELSRSTYLASDTNIFDSTARTVSLPFDFEARSGPHRMIVRISEDGRAYPLAFAFDVPDRVPDETRDRVETTGEHLLAAIEEIPRVRLPDQLDGLLTGKTEVEVQASKGVSRIEFRMDDELVAVSQQAPFRAELDFGEVPRTRTLSVMALTGDGKIVARDEVTVNQGAQHFDARLLDLTAVRRPGETDRVFLRPRVQISVPHGRLVDRVELFVDDRPIGTLYQPPWAKTLELSQSRPSSQGKAPTVVRAVVHLDVGRSREVAGLVGGKNSALISDSVEVDLVEVFASVTGRGGKAITDLKAGEMQVFEDGEPQRVLKFQQMRDLPINVVLLLDTSTSMTVHSSRVKEAAGRFLRDVVTEKDRAALIQFDTVPRVVVPLTSDRKRLEQAADVLWIQGGTAFRDSIVTSLHYLSGVRGRRALVVLTDGVDEHSLLTMHQTLEYAQRAEIAIYTIGMGLTGNLYAQPADGSATSFEQRREAERALVNLAQGSGGLAFQVSDPAKLPGIYRQIEDDLRQQVLVTYQSSQQGEAFRRYQVKVDRPRAKVRTAAGYYP